MQTLHATLSQLITVEGHNGSYKMLGKAKTAKAFTHEILRFSGKRVWIIKLHQNASMAHAKIMQAHKNGDIDVHPPHDKDDAKVINMWLGYMGVPWHVTEWPIKDDTGEYQPEWVLTDANETGIAAKFAEHKDHVRPVITIYAKGEA